MQQWDALYLNARIATMNDDHVAYGLLNDAALAVTGDKIVWIGLVNQLPGEPKNLAKTLFDLEGRCVTPTLIDCHTHLVYAGNRYQEFEMRLQGASYEAIAMAGGGIHSTVAATRLASEDELLEQSLKRAKALLAEGVTTIEIKSGYGLNIETELKMLRVAKRIGQMLPVTIFPTYLGAHALPAEFKGKADEYIDYVCHEMLPPLVEEGLVKAVDVFCENIAFDLAQTERVFKTAREFNLPVKCHAEQLSNIGASFLAAQFKALSVEHLEHISAESVNALAEAGTVAVMLPGAYYYLRETKIPPVEILRAAGVPMAVATDCNPGTSPVTSLLLMLNMACTLFRLTPEEALKGVTINAAKALGLEGECGSLAVGKKADFVVWDIQHPAELSYYIGANPLFFVVKGGRRIQSSYLVSERRI